VVRRRGREAGRVPEVRIELVSQRGRAVSDRPRRVKLRGRQFVHVPASDVEYRDGALMMDVPPDTYALEVEVDGFRPYDGRLTVTPDSKRGELELKHRCTLLPSFSQLKGEPQRLFRSYAGGQDGGEAWGELSDNQACTFFQVTYALAETTVGGKPLSSYLERVERIGGAEIAGEVKGQTKRAVGWRLHVGVKSGEATKMAELLTANGFAADSGPAHPTHAKFGFVHSFRQKGKNPRLQLVFAAGFARADVDVDNGKFHLSSPYHVYSALRKKFPEVHEVYRVS